MNVNVLKELNNCFLKVNEVNDLFLYVVGFILFVKYVCKCILWLNRFVRN